MEVKRLTEQEVRRRVIDMLHCRMSGQIDRMLGNFSREAIVHYTSSREGLLPPATWEGRDALRSITRCTDENYAPVDYEILDCLVEGASAVVRWRGAWRRHATGRVYMIDAAHFLRWEGDCVVEMHEFFERMCAPGPCCEPLRSFGDLLVERLPGWDREEMKRRAEQLVLFPSNRPDVALIREYCSPDIICEFVGDRVRLPYAGRHVGVEALVNIVRTISVEFEQKHCEVVDMIADGGRLAGVRRVEWRHRGTGRRGLVHLADFVRFENGLIVELIEFRDSLTLLEMQGDR